MYIKRGLTLFKILLDLFNISLKNTNYNKYFLSKVNSNLASSLLFRIIIGK